MNNLIIKKFCKYFIIDFPLILCALALCFTVISCVGTKQDVDIYQDIDYTEADALNNELKNINNLIEKEPVKALWRSYLLFKQFPNDDSVIHQKELCEENLTQLYSDALSQKKYLRALRLYDSLKATSYNDLNKLQNTSELSNLIKKDIPGISNEGTSWDGKMSSLVNGTVTVYVDRGMKVQGGYALPDAVLGSGFFISKNGYIVTNHHVISSCVDPTYEGYARLYIKLAQDPDTRIPARVIGYDSVVDLALLKTEVDAPYVFTLGSSSDLEVGDRVYAIGSPLGLDRTLTSGVISATDRSLVALGKVFQIDAAVNSGNSGGPLVDSQGKVQAIVFAGVQNYQGLNFAIPVEYLKSELHILYNGGERRHPWIEAYGRTKRNAGANANNEGLEVQYVIPGGSAYLAGLRSGDVIISVNEKPITSIDDFHLEMLTQLSSSIVNIKAQNDNGEEKVYTVYLTDRPEYPGYTVYTRDLISQAMIALTGMELVRASTENSNIYSVKRVIKGSSAEESGFSEGDIVQIARTELNEDKSALIVVLSTRKNKNGYIDISIAVAVPLDNPYYF